MEVGRQCGKGDCRRNSGTMVSDTFIWFLFLWLSLPFAAGAQAGEYPIKDSRVLHMYPTLSLNMVAWLDNTHVAINSETVTLQQTGKSLGGARATEYGLYLWDTTTNTVTKHRTLEHKTSLCAQNGVLSYLHKGIIVTWKPGEAEQERPLSYPFWFNPFSCRYYDSQPPWKRGGLTAPLLDEHGYVDLSPPAIDEERSPLLYRPGVPEGKVLPFPKGVGGPFGYAPFRTAYLFMSVSYQDPVTGKLKNSTEWPKGKPMSAWWLTPDGTVAQEAIPYHPFIAGRLDFLPVKGGVFVGGYLVRDGTTRNVIQGILHSPVVSPDGCRVAFVHEPDPPTDVAHRNTLEVKMVDLCDGGTHE